MNNHLIQETGQVVRIDGDDAIVAVVRTSACQSCKARQGCGQAVLAEWGSAEHQQSKNHFRIPLDRSLAPGDLVELGMPEDTVSRVAMLVYLLPLVVAFVVLLISSAMGLSELWQLVGLVFGFGAGVAIARRLSQHKVSALTPQILRSYSSGQASETIASSRL